MLLYLLFEQTILFRKFLLWLIAWVVLIDYCLTGIKEVVTLTSDLSRKNLEKDFERMDTPQGTFYRVYFDIYLTLDGSEFNAELVCQGEVMGSCTGKFK